MIPAKILLIDPNKKDARYILNLLTGKGYNVSHSIDAKAALKRIDEIKFDLIIMELELEGIKGRALYKKLRAKKKAKGLPILVLTAQDDIDEIEELFQQNVDGYIIKPPRNSYLLSRVELLLAAGKMKKVA